MSMETRPNILILMTDQQRYDSLGCYGCGAAHTPNLDRLAAQGALFEHCYVNNPLCTPSRASMLTGRHLPGHGVYQLHDILPPDQVLFPEYLRRAGYQTALFGKLHVSGHRFEVSQRHAHDGFEIYEWCPDPALFLDPPFNGYASWLAERDPGLLQRLRTEGRKVKHIPRAAHLTHWSAERTIDFIQKGRDASRPFFCLTSVFDPHSPYDNYPLEMADLIDQNKIADPLLVDGELEQTPILRRIHEEMAGEPRPDATLEDFRAARLGYQASIALIDLEFGGILQALDEAGLAENTFVIFLSDHGDMLGDHQQVSKGAALYEPCVRVPLIMRWPERFAAGRRLHQLVQLHDLAATVLAAAGILDDAVQAAMPDSRDLSQLCTGEVAAVHDAAYCLYRNSGFARTHVRSVYFDPPLHATMIRNERFKLVIYHAPGAGNRQQGQLFDMISDPLEAHNLWDAPAYADVRHDMAGALLDWLVAQEVRALGGRGGHA